MVGTMVLYHPEADAPGQAALVVGVNGPVREDDGPDPVISVETVNLLVFPDAGDADLESVLDAIEGGESADPPPSWMPGWMPYRAAEVHRDQVGKASGPFWEPIG